MVFLSEEFSAHIRKPNIMTYFLMCIKRLNVVIVLFNPLKQIRFVTVSFGMLTSCDQTCLGLE